MKKLIIYSFMSIFLLAIACKKNENTKVPDFTKIAAPLILKDTKTDQTIIAQTPELFNATFTVGLQFPDGVKPAKFDVLIKKTSGTTVTVKTYKTDITTFPTALSITGPQLKTLFNNQEILLNDKFEIGVDITSADGKKYFAFPTDGAAYGSGVASAAGASLTVTYQSICKFFPAEYAGTFKVLAATDVIEEGFPEFPVGSDVVITVVNDHQLSFVSPVNKKTIIVDINVITNEVTVKPQSYGDYKAIGFDPGWPYGDVTIQTVKSANNFVAPCDVILSMQLGFTVSAGSFGNATFKFQKK